MLLLFLSSIITPYHRFTTQAPTALSVRVCACVTHSTFHAAVMNHEDVPSAPSAPSAPSDPSVTRKRARAPKRPIGAASGRKTQHGVPAPPSSAARAAFQTLQRDSKRLERLVVNGLEDVRPPPVAPTPKAPTAPKSQKSNDGTVATTLLTPAQQRQQQQLKQRAERRANAHVLCVNMVRAAPPAVCISYRSLIDVAAPHIAYDNDAISHAVTDSTQDDVLLRATSRLAAVGAEHTAKHIIALRTVAAELMARAAAMHGMHLAHPRALLRARAADCTLSADSLERAGTGTGNGIGGTMSVLECVGALHSAITAVRAREAQASTLHGDIGENNALGAAPVPAPEPEPEQNDTNKYSGPVGPVGPVVDVAVTRAVQSITARGAWRVLRGGQAHRRRGVQFTALDVLLARARASMSENAAIFVDMGLCTACGRMMQLTDSHIFVCVRCKFTSKEPSFFSSDVNRSGGGCPVSRSAVAGHKASTTAQRAMTHFQRRLDGIQGRLHRYIPESAYLALCRYLYDNGIGRDVTAWQMRHALSACKLTKYYDYYQQLRMMISGIQPRQLSPVLSSEIQIMVRMMFQVWPEFRRMIDDEDDRRRRLAGKPPKKRRRNAPNSAYCFLAAASLRGHPEMLDEVFTIWAPDNIADKERIRALVFATFGWQFVPLVIPRRPTPPENVAQNGTTKTAALVPVETTSQSGDVQPHTTTHESTTSGIGIAVEAAQQTTTSHDTNEVVIDIVTAIPVKDQRVDVTSAERPVGVKTVAPRDGRSTAQKRRVKFVDPLSPVSIDSQRKRVKLTPGSV